MPQEITGPGFSFELPPISKGSLNTDMSDNEEPIQFAVQPFDSRYYNQQSIPQDDVLVEEAPLERPEVATTIKTNLFENGPFSSGRNKILIPSPMHINENLQTSGETQSRILHRAQQKQQMLKQANSDVMQKPLMEFENSNMNLYLVALIAGISCAFSTGVGHAMCSLRKISINIFFSPQLIALGLMYWTLKKKVKSGKIQQIQSIAKFLQISPSRVHS